MKSSLQQNQTKKYFDMHAKKWFKKARLSSKNYVNVIKQRNKYVEDVCSQFLNKNAKILDVGCGTGDLVISLLKKKYNAYGVDFSPSMIKKARKECKKQGFLPDRFFLNSFFKFIPNTKYDLISANGFIEYISEKELTLFIKKCHTLLHHDGLLVVGSRNRLFNIFSFNEYTESEIKDGSIISLLKECIIFNSSRNFKDILKKKISSTLTKNLKNHANTGIGVKTRYQYTPYQIMNKLEKSGFNPIDLMPIHIHVLTTSAKNVVPIIHDYTSNYLQKMNEINFQVIPQSSSFMTTARKK